MKKAKLFCNWCSFNASSYITCMHHAFYIFIAFLWSQNMSEMMSFHTEYIINIIMLLWRTTKNTLCIMNTKKEFLCDFLPISLDEEETGLVVCDTFLDFLSLFLFHGKNDILSKFCLFTSFTFTALNHLKWRKINECLTKVGINNWKTSFEETLFSASKKPVINAKIDRKENFLL